jgi:hypothetical protein
MNRVGRVVPYLLFACLFLTVSCATTKLTESWRDEGFRGRIGKCVVIGVFKEPDTRKIFEDELADRLRARGVEAVASHKIITDAELSDKDLVLRKVRNTGADGLFVMRLLDMETVTTHVPGRSYLVPGYYGYYGTYYTHIYEPGYTVREGYAYAETNLYDVGNEKLIWSGRSTTTLSKTRYELIQAFVKTVIGKLAEDKLIR